MQATRQGALTSSTHRFYSDEKDNTSEPTKDLAAALSNDEADATQAAPAKKAAPAKETGTTSTLDALAAVTTNFKQPSKADAKVGAVKPKEIKQGAKKRAKNSRPQVPLPDVNLAGLSLKAQSPEASASTLLEADTSQQNLSSRGLAIMKASFKRTDGYFAPGKLMAPHGRLRIYALRL